MKLQKLSKSKNRKGFSLIELMVVVAIIGILATLGIGGLQKQILKARQAEASTILKSLYSAEKSFFASYNTFDSGFGTIGFKPEGKLRYDLGFATDPQLIGVLNGFGYAATALPTFNPQSLSGSKGQPACELAAAVVKGNQTCILLQEGVDAKGEVKGTFTRDEFNVQASSKLSEKAAADFDTWEIDENGVITQTMDGIN